MTNTSLDTIREHFSGNRWPEFLNIESRDNTVSLQLNVHAEIHWFDGHFPEQPVLAGVCQTHWAGEIGKFLFPTGEDFCRIDNLKFQMVILPDTQLSLNLEYVEAQNAIKFSFRADEKHYSEGKIVFNKTES